MIHCDTEERTVHPERLLLLKDINHKSSFLFFDKFETSSFKIVTK